MTAGVEHYFLPYSENAVVSAKQKDGEPLLSATQVVTPPSFLAVMLTLTASHRYGKGWWK